MKKENKKDKVTFSDLSWPLKVAATLGIGYAILYGLFFLLGVGLGIYEGLL